MADMKFDAENSDIIKVIQDSVQPEAIEVAEDKYVTREVYLPPIPPVVSALKLHTLQGVADYLNDDAKLDKVLPADTNSSGLAVHVVSESLVKVVGPVYGRFRQRETFIEASPHQILGANFAFSQYAPLELFNIALKALFILTDDVDEILKITGGITQEDIEQWKDDGVSQTVIATTGIARRGEVNIARLYNLKPYRTFREIDQPSGDFLLRLQKGTPPKAALFETDGGQWKLLAIARIKSFLKENLRDGLEVPILG